MENGKCTKKPFRRQNGESFDAANGCLRPLRGVDVSVKNEG